MSVYNIRNVYWWDKLITYDVQEFETPGVVWRVLTNLAPSDFTKPDYFPGDVKKNAEQQRQLFFRTYGRLTRLKVCEDCKLLYDEDFYVKHRGECAGDTDETD